MIAAYALEGLIRRQRYIASPQCPDCQGTGYGYEPCDEEAFPCGCHRAVDVLNGWHGQTYVSPGGAFTCWLCREQIEGDWTRCIGLRVHWACQKATGLRPDLISFPGLYGDMTLYDLEAALICEAAMAVAS